MRSLPLAVSRIRRLRIRCASPMSTTTTPRIELPHTSGCLVCGRQNNYGLKMSLFVDPASGIVSIDFSPKPIHIGFEGIVHGGFLATLFDEAMVWAATWANKRFC